MIKNIKNELSKIKNVSSSRIGKCSITIFFDYGLSRSESYDILKSVLEIGKRNGMPENKNTDWGKNWMQIQY